MEGIIVMTGVRKLLLVTVAAVALYTAPVMAADDENLNSGFGKDMFAGEEHPAFVNPSIHDPADLGAISPAAGTEEKEAPEDADDVPAVAGQKDIDGVVGTEELPYGTGGMVSTFPVK